MMNKGITVIVCTFNGVGRLEETIKHLAKQEVPENISWEVILSDNSSTDNSSEFSRLEWLKYNPTNVPLRIIKEMRPGKLYALQQAVLAANYENFIICDDDNWLDKDYIARVYEILESNPEVGALGGFGIPVTTGEPLPEWFRKYEFAYAVGPQAKKEGLMPPRSILWGAGLATRKSLYLKMYENCPSFFEGQSVEMILAEDTEYCLRLSLKGYRMYYDSKLIYHHFIQGTKLTPEYRDKQLKRFHESGIILKKYYAAIRATIKTKGRPDIWLFLFLISPFNYIFSFNKLRAEKAKDTFLHLLPFNFFSPGSLSFKLKEFIKQD